MKNTVIVLLIVIAGLLGYLLFTKESNKDTPNSTPTTSTEQTTKTDGKEINLSNRNLDQISKDILDDASVTKLDVSGNNLTDSLPGEIRMLTNLEILDASDNKMTGVPAEIGQLSKLKTVNYSNNDLSGLPMEFGNLKNLETLDLRGNPNISKMDLASIQKEIPNASILTD